MLSPDYIIIILVVLLLWLAAISFYLKKTVDHYKKLTLGQNKQTLDKILENIIEKQNQNTNHITGLNALQVTMQRQSVEFFQKLALIRFNPFEDAGGDQSFVVALLDGQGNGVVISSLHSRSGTRVYTKGVSAAKSTTHAFTKEEKEAVEKAMRKKNN